MHINLEAKDQYTIEAYSEKEIRINGITYQQNLIVSTTELIADWTIDSINQLTTETLSPMMKYQPKIILIGHSKPNCFASPAIIQTLAKQQIALECMQIGPACRTFNVLLNEKRNVVLGIIL